MKLWRITHVDMQGNRRKLCVLVAGWYAGFELVLNALGPAQAMSAIRVPEREGL